MSPCLENIPPEIFEKISGLGKREAYMFFQYCLHIEAGPSFKAQEINSGIVGVILDAVKASSIC